MVSDKLYLARRNAELTIEEAAEQIGVGAEIVMDWESGKAVPDVMNFRTLAKVYGTTVDDILLAKTAAAEEASFEVDGDFSEITETKRYKANKPEKTVVVDHDEFSFDAGPLRFRLSRSAFPYPVIVAAFYLVLGMVFRWWDPTWLLFLTIPLYYTWPDLSGRKSIKRELQKFAYPVLVVIAYILLGYMLGTWAYGVILFATIPVYYILLAHAEER
ncbi:hypothetical protein FACS18948_0120 [Clostridia bacterium]|nr:hypothetical protein FACS18948_0120 [Clostridia bacterium]